MIIRRLVTAVRQQDWGLAALDFLIVVAGIFVGLQVDDWNQRLADREEEKLLLRGLLVDLQTTRADYARSDEQLAGWITDAENALRAVQNDQEFLNTVGYSIRTLQFNAGWYKMSISEIDDLISQIESELIKLEESP